MKKFASVALTASLVAVAFSSAIPMEEASAFEGNLEHKKSNLSGLGTERQIEGDVWYSEDGVVYVEAFHNATRLGDYSVSLSGKDITKYVKVSEKAVDSVGTNVFLEINTAKVPEEMLPADGVWKIILRAPFQEKQASTPSKTPEPSVDPSDSAKPDPSADPSEEPSEKPSDPVEPEKEEGIVEVEFNLDNVNPTLENMSVTPNHIKKGGDSYFQEKVEFHFDPVDGQTGVLGVELLKMAKDGSIEKVIPISEGVTETGTYKVRVTDRVGNSTTYTMKDFGLEGDIVINSTPPSIVDKVNATPNEDGWFEGDDVSISAEFTSQGILLNESIVKVNGEKVYSKTIPGRGNKDFVTINLADRNLIPLAEDGIYEVTLIATTWAGAAEEKTIIIKIDNESPNLNLSDLKGDYKVVDGALYVKGDLEFTVAASDPASGIAKKELIKDGTVVSEINGDTVRLSESGEYLVRVTDKVGHVTEMNVFETFNLPSKMIRDSSAPNITFNLPKADLEKNGKIWYKSEPSFSIPVADENLATSKVLVNGQEVSSLSGQGTHNFSLKGIEPGEDLSYQIEVISTDKAGNESRVNKTVYVDNKKPQITDIRFSLAGRESGSAKGVGDGYSHFFQSGVDVTVTATDPGASAGLGKLVYKYNTDKGEVTKEEDISSGTATIKLGDDFKGFVSMHVTDVIGHVSDPQATGGIITESASVHVNNSDVGFRLPETNRKDINGLPLYSEPITVGVYARDSRNGIGSLKWSLGSNSGEQSVNADGSTSGPFSVKSKDKNLVSSVESNFRVTDNANGIGLSFLMSDRAGWESSAKDTFSIDTDAPVVSVSYNNTIESGFYNAPRTAEIRVTERNFTPDGVKLSGAHGDISGWRNVGDNVWVATMTFAANKEYSWGLTATDLAGNVSTAYSSEKFTVDTVNPNMSVTMLNTDLRNGKFYSKNQTAQVTVTDENISPENVTVEGGTLTGWSSRGNVHTFQVPFTTDGSHKFSVQVRDKAGNVGEKFDSPEFTIDSVSPVLQVDGVKAGVSYRKGIEFTGNFSDDNIDLKNSTFSLQSRSGKKVKLNSENTEKGGKFSFDNPALELENDDFYVLKANIKDLAGNETAQEVPFSINRFGSLYSFLEEDYLGKYLNTVGDVKVEETSVDRLEMKASKQEVILDGIRVPITVDQVDITESGGKRNRWKYLYDMRSDIFKKDGTYQLQYFSKTVNGDENSSLSQEYVFTLDRQEPAIVVSGVDSDATYKEGERKVAVEIQDSSPIKSMEILLNGNKLDVSTEDGVYTFPVLPSTGPQSLTVTAEDAAGNVKEVVVDNFQVSNNSLEGATRSGWFIGLVSAVGIALLGGILFLLARGKKRSDEDKKRAALASELSASAESLQSGGSSM